MDEQLSGRQSRDLIRGNTAVRVTNPEVFWRLLRRRSRKKTGSSRVISDTHCRLFSNNASISCFSDIVETTVLLAELGRRWTGERIRIIKELEVCHLAA